MPRPVARLARPAPRPPQPAQLEHATSPSASALAGIRSRDRSTVLGSAPTLAGASVTTFDVTTEVDSANVSPTGTTCTDSETTPECSLRAAVEAANNLGTPVVIDVPAGTYTLSLGQLTVDNQGGTSIVGAGASTTTIAGDGTGLIDLTGSNGATLWLTGLSLTGGSGSDGGALEIDYASDSAVLDQVTITRNAATGYGGAIDCGFDEEGGSLWAIDSTISNNTAEEGGGIYSYWCGLQLNNTDVTSNTATDDAGGGILMEYGSLTAKGGKINSNVAGGASTAGYGGGIYNEYGVDALYGVKVNYNKVLDGGEGGGDLEDYSQLTATGGTFSSDQALGASSYGGGLYLDEGAQVSLHGVTLDHDSTGVTDTTSYGEGGGAIYDYAEEYGNSLTIDDASTLMDNATGAVVAYGYYGGSTLAISDSTIEDNTSPIEYQAGGLTAYQYEYGGMTVTLDGDTITGNTESGSYSAGGVMVWPEYYGGVSLAMSGDTVSQNSSSGSEGSGGVIAYAEEYSNLSVSVSGSSFTGNSAPNGGFGGALDVYGDDDYSPTELSVTGSTFDANSAGSAAAGEEGYGGALFEGYYGTVSISSSELSGNTAVGGSAKGGAGGAFYSESYQSAAFSGDRIVGNAATGLGSYGGGVVSYDEAGDTYTSTAISGNRAVYGGGIYFDGYTQIFNDSTVSGNVAGSDTVVGFGGGIYNEDGELQATDTTFADNHALDGGEGGAIANYSSGHLEAEYSTIADNSAANGGAIYEDGDGGTFLASIVAGNTTGGSAPTLDNCDVVRSSFGSSGGNVFGSSDCVAALATGDLVTSDPGLAPLGSYGGATQTVKLKATSPARTRASGTCPATDQRGEPRPATGCSAGAYQFAPGAIASLGRVSAPAGVHITLFGHGFLFARRVMFGGRMATFTVMSDTKIVATVPAGYAAGTKVTVKVVTPDGHGATARFTYK
ncbi:MAG TPA: IPT/TIG domain-containing protein [Acidimicrobiales bacterium]|nr:IPT/TIG domain-containing protein [Acidimicrobiales bacterium]